MIILEFNFIDKDDSVKAISINAYSYSMHYDIGDNKSKIHLLDGNCFIVNHSYEEIKEKLKGTKFLRPPRSPNQGQRTFIKKPNFNRQHYNQPRGDYNANKS